LKASLRSGRSVLYALFLCYPCLSFGFASFTLAFVHQLQTAENTIFWVKDNIFYSGLDGTMIRYTILLVLPQLKLGKLLEF
jgi:hypothetical protein